MVKNAILSKDREEVKTMKMIRREEMNCAARGDQNRKTLKYTPGGGMVAL